MRRIREGQDAPAMGGMALTEGEFGGNWRRRNGDSQMYRPEDARRIAGGTTTGPMSDRFRSVQRTRDLPGQSSRFASSSSGRLAVRRFVVGIAGEWNAPRRDERGGRRETARGGRPVDGTHPRPKLGAAARRRRSSGDCPAGRRRIGETAAHSSRDGTPDPSNAFILLFVHALVAAPSLIRWAERESRWDDRRWVSMFVMLLVPRGAIFYLFLCSGATAPPTLPPPSARPR